MSTLQPAEAGGTIDGISYASTSYVYDSSGFGVLTDILYLNQSGVQVADQTIYGVNSSVLSYVKTANPDGSFTLKVTTPGGHGGIDQGYTLDSFSSTGLWLREDQYSPIFTDPSNPGGSGVSGYTDTSYILVKAQGAGSSGTIGGAYYDMVQTHYTSAGQMTETDYINDLNGTYTVVSKQVFTPPDPVLNISATATATTGTSTLIGGSITDAWAGAHAGSLALNISVDSGTVSGTDSAGHVFTATPGSAAHLTGTLAQLNAELVGLSYTGQTGTAHVAFQVYDQAGVEASQTETITVTPPTAPPPPINPNPDPVLGGASTLTIATDGRTYGVGVTFSDPWAVNHAGSLALNVTTTLGTLTDTVAGHTTTGASLHLTGTYQQISADIIDLALSSNQAGTGTLRIEVYDQAGAEAVQVIGVTAHAPASA